jgi:hypothetical protein
MPIIIREVLMKYSIYSVWSGSKTTDAIQAKIDRIFVNRMVRRKILFAS